MTHKDCLLIGFNDTDFPSFVDMARGAGENSGAFRDVNLAFAELDGKPYRCLDLLNKMYADHRCTNYRPFENCDFVWPVILYLGSYLERRGLSFDSINLFHRDRDKTATLLQSNHYNAIVITTTVYVSPQPILEIVEFIRDHDKTTPIIIGGPYVSNQHKVMGEEDLLRLFRFLGGDIYVISAEGEQTLSEILVRIASGGQLDEVDNVSIRGTDGIFTRPTLSTERTKLEDEPVNYRLFSREEMGEFVSLRTAKSCPFACAFCGFPQRAGKYEYNSVSAVARELDAIAELGDVTTLTFLDDTFNVPKRRFKEILRLMIDRNYGFRWNSFYRSDHGDLETIELMAESGCEGVFLGIESGSDKMLELMNKTARKADYEVAIERLRKVGILSYCSFIIGFPGETLETVSETKAFIENTAPDFYRAQLFYLDPATPVWQQREKYMVSGGGFEWSHSTMEAEIASDLIDDMFLTVRNSIWAPQHGFEDWSIYYLMRRGFSIYQVKEFVKLFDDLVRLKFANNKVVGTKDTILAGISDLVLETQKCVR